jgi:hypothetical protein
MKLKLLRFGKKKEETLQVEEPEEIVEPAPKPEKEPLIPPEELEKFVGKHVAIVGRKIVAASENAKRTWKMARRKYRASTIALRYVGNKNLLLKCKCLKK